jgi:hypothetical protein
MEMEITVPTCGPGYLADCCVYDEMTTFTKTLEERFGVLEDVTLSVGLVPAGYYQNQESHYGYFGCCEDRSSKESDERPKFDKTTETLNITFLATSDWVARNRTRLDLLYTTPGERPSAHRSVWRFEPLMNQRTIVKKYGLYKKPSFDPIYMVMKQYFPTMTEMDLARYRACDFDDEPNDSLCHNSDFAEILPYTTDHQCLKTWEHHETQQVPTNKVRVIISIITTDLERNTPTLIELLADRKILKSS